MLDFIVEFECTAPGHTPSTPHYLQCTHGGQGQYQLHAAALLEEWGNAEQG